MSPSRRVLPLALMLSMLAMTMAASAFAQFYDPVLRASGLDDKFAASPRLLGMGGLGLAVADRDREISLWDLAANPLGVTTSNAGRGRSLLEGPLTLSLARTGEGRAAWLAVRSASASSLSIAGTRADDMVATLELHGGVAMDVSMQYPGPELARSAAAEIGRLLDGFKPMVTNLGVPKTVVDSLRVDGAGAFVNVRARGNVADLETISAVIVRIIVTGAP